MADLARDLPLSGNWSGAFYELAFEVGDRDDARLDTAIRALWRAAAIEGCYVTRATSPTLFDEVTPSLASLERNLHLYGAVVLPDGHRVPCGCVVVREIGDGPDWLDFYLPLDGLLGVDPAVSAAWLPGPSPRWDAKFLARIDSWFADVASRVFVEVPFQVALIGEEVSGAAYADELRATSSQQRRFGYLLPDGARLRHYPAT